MLRRGASWSRRRCEAAAQPQGACHAPPPPSPSSPFPFPHPPPLTPTACSRAARAAAGGPPWPAGEPRRGAGAAGIVPHPALLLALQPPGGCDGPVGRAAPSAACAAPRVGSGPRGPGPAMCSCDPPPHTCVPLVFVMFPPTHPWAAAAQPRAATCVPPPLFSAGFLALLPPGARWQWRLPGPVRCSQACCLVVCRWQVSGATPRPAAL
jgi:hypothetical protein